MSNDLTTTSKRSLPGKVTGRLKQAIDLMVWQNLTDNEAAVKVRMTVQAIRYALKRPHVVRYLREQREVMHTRELARNSHTLVDIRDNSKNAMARVAAVRELEQRHDEDAKAPAAARTPGIVIQIIAAEPASPRVIEGVRVGNAGDRDE
ncbi:MAG TPA: hypothetical protein VNQ99_16170 [Xanthobacteraceae bacterium]|nr:hypothetical protein [Xanthobacteraceae bacterium]